MSTRGTGSGGERPPRRPPRNGKGRGKGRGAPSASQRASAVARNPVVRAVTYWTLIGIGALLLLLWVVSGPVCGISNVTVKGYTGKDTAAVQETAELVASTGSMVRLPVGDMRKALTRFPGVIDTDVTRDWPRSVTVTVTMGEPVAILDVESGGRYLLSPTGQVMGTAGTTVGLPVISVKTTPPGGVLTDPGQRAALLFIGWLPPEIAGRLRKLRFEGGRLFAELANGLELRIGPPDQLAEKAQALVAVLSQADPAALARAAYLDISNPRRPMLGSRVVTVPDPVTGTSSTGDTATTDEGTDTTVAPENTDTTGDSVDETSTSG